MEPWQLEQQWQTRSRRRAAGLPRCVCCDMQVVTEQYLPLEAFGLRGVACERCVEENMAPWERLGSV